MSKEIWIKSGNKVVGPGTVEQFLNAFRKGTLRANSTFSTQSSGSWLPLSEFPPAAPLAVEANGWFWVSTGFASDDQIGPCDGKELLQERDQRQRLRSFCWWNFDVHTYTHTTFLPI